MSLRFIVLSALILYLQQPVHSGFLEEVCMLPTDQGSACDKSPATLQFGFNTEKEQCVSFLYKGCKGNDNRFTLQDDCIDSCQTEWFRKKNKKKKKKKMDSEEENELDFSAVNCKVEPDRGPCKALITQWYFDSKSRECDTFVYGGCKGNSNRFNTDKQCKAACS